MDRVEAFRNEVIRLVNETTDIVTFGRILSILKENEIEVWESQPDSIERYRERTQKSLDSIKKGLVYTADEARQLLGIRKKVIHIEEKDEPHYNDISGNLPPQKPQKRP
jgi:hypothetical protein